MSYKNGWSLEGYGISLEKLINKNVIDISMFIKIHGFEDDLDSDFNIENYKSMKDFYKEYESGIKNLISDGGVPLSCGCELTPYNIYYLITNIKPWENSKPNISNREDAQKFIFNTIKIFLNDNVKFEDLVEDFDDIAEGWEE